ncbi:MAG: hypothetical protein JNL58_31285, partial [Planctomyces sp.]|nr:hypothetical protein [Planctomyces sp.]
MTTDLDDINRALADATYNPQSRTPASRANQPQETGNSPPHDLDAETSLLGSIFLMPEALEEIEVNPSWFYSKSHELVAQTIVTMHSENHPAIDSVTIADELTKNGKLAEVGGVPFLLEISEAVPNAAHCRYYAGIVKEHYLKRQTIHSLKNIIDAAYRPTSKADEILKQAAERIDRIKSQQTEVVETSFAGVDASELCTWATLEP